MYLRRKVFITTMIISSSFKSNFCTLDVCDLKPCPVNSYCKSGNNSFDCLCNRGYQHIKGSGSSTICQGK